MTRLKLKTLTLGTTLAAAVIVGAAAIPTLAEQQRRDPQRPDAQQQRGDPQAAEQFAQGLRGWHEDARKAARDMITKYGEPDEVTDSRLIWHNNGPWVQTIIYRETVDHEFPKPHVDLLEQSIYYRVPPEKYTALAQYDGSVIIERTKGTLAARCDQEAANFLALNLAYDIIHDRRSVEEAREFYAETVRQMMEVMERGSGEMPEYARGLVFRPQTQEQAADPDTSVLEE